MKKLWLSMMLSGIALSGLHAQEESPIKGHISVLAKIGLTGAVLNGKDVDQDNIKREPSLLVGANVDYHFSPIWSIRSGLIYEKRKFDSGLAGVTQKSSYLTIPVTANVHFKKRKRWNVNLGPAVSFNLSNKTDGINTRKDTKSVDLGMELGTGFKVPVSKSFLYLEINSFAGLINPVKNSNNKATWSRVSLNAGYIF